MIGYVVLHELFHLDSLSQVGNQGHIEDLRMAYGPEGSDRVIYRRVYGPLMTKIMAAWGDSGTLQI
jgi:hypothetical protein